jgi:hypothetical protein
MRSLLFVIALATVLPASAQDKDSKKSQTPKAAAAAESRRDAVPPDAKEIEPGVWRWKDEKGKTWILRRSPFGLLKGEEKQEKTEAARDADDPSLALKVTEEGDQLRFERRTPFGVSRWTKKKTELDELEQRAWEREQKRRAENLPKE